MIVERRRHPFWVMFRAAQRFSVRQSRPPDACGRHGARPFGPPVRRIRMLSRFIPRLTFANVISLLALVIALGGSAYAAVSLPRNSVGTKQLKKRAVTNSKLANGAVTGPKVRSGSLTGKQINSSTLRQVPSAAHADTADAATNATHAGSADAAT